MLQLLHIIYTRRIWPYGPNLLTRGPWPVGPWPLGPWPVGSKDKQHVKSITYKALAQGNATTNYGHSGEMLSWGL